MEAKYNTKSPAVKRLMREASELHAPTADYFAQPLDDNLFEWHFTVRGPDDTAFAGGVYHGRIVLPAEYPMKPPSIIMLTPNGRFETSKKICLSISGHHPESWRPSWSIRTALMAIIGFLPSPAGGAIASLEYSDDERRALAASSLRWRCATCGPPHELLAARDADPATHESRQREARQLAAEVQFQGEKPKAAAAAADTDTPPAEPGGAPDQPPVLPPVEQRAQRDFARRPGGELADASWPSGTLIVVLVVAIAALLCRRLFLLDARRLDGLSGGM